MGVWQRLARVLGQGDERSFEEAEQILLEADFGVQATEDLIAGLRSAPAAEREGYLERAVATLLAGPVDPGTVARAAEPPTVVLVDGLKIFSCPPRCT